MNINMNIIDTAKSLGQLKNMHSSATIDGWWPLLGNDSNLQVSHIFERLFLRQG
jgi:hypothetical protein